MRPIFIPAKKKKNTKEKYIKKPKNKNKLINGEP